MRILRILFSENTCVATLLLRWNAYTFIYKLKINLIYGIHNSLPGLLGYLILLATQAFVPQRLMRWRVEVFAVSSLVTSSAALACRLERLYFSRKYVKIFDPVFPINYEYHY
jgi:hypothetical protein